MATTDTPTVHISTEDSKKVNWARQLTGTSFLTLEHTAYFALVVVLPVVLLAGVSNAVSLWSGSSSMLIPAAAIFESALRAVDTTLAVMISAALLVLVPLLYVLRRRTAAEYAKRPGYTGRVGYKLPVYSALAVLGVFTVSSFIGMLDIFMNSLVNIGVTGANIGDMYLHGFLPALLSFVVFGLSAWYVLQFAKGRDESKSFVSAIGVLGAVMVIALFITALTLNHQSKAQDNPLYPVQPYNSLENNNSYFDY